MAATTASINMAIPSGDTVIPSFFSKIIKLTPIMENIIPIRFIRVIFSFKKNDEVNEVNKGEECGIQYEGKPIIEEGDVLHFYKEEKIAKKL